MPFRLGIKNSKKRKTSNSETISDRDIEKNFSFQHFKTNEEIRNNTVTLLMCT